MAILIADTKLETETDAWYMFYADTKEDIQTLPTSTSTGSSYRVRKYARPTSVAYCIEEARQYMLDSKDRWRAMCGLSDSVLDALSKSAAELLVICKDTENFRDEAAKVLKRQRKIKKHLLPMLSLQIKARKKPVRARALLLKKQKMRKKQQKLQTNPLKKHRKVRQVHLQVSRLRLRAHGFPLLAKPLQKMQ